MNWRVRPRVKSFSETREKFWNRLRVRGYRFIFLLLLFREIGYNDRKRWLAPKSKHSTGGNKTIVFKTTFNCNDARIKPDITRFGLHCLLQIYCNFS